MRRKLPPHPPCIYRLGEGMDELTVGWPRPLVREYNHVIYGLRAADESLFRYVGCTNGPARRLMGHWTERRRAQDPKGTWLAELMQRGEKPVLVVLEMTTAAKRQELEQRWIRFFRDLGHPLLNRRDW